jgi:sulfatase maturation enzyme AslB (radical SAM superfamily)
VAYLVHAYNYREIFEAAKKVKHAGASYIQIRPVFLRGMTLSPETLQEMYRQITLSMDLSNETFMVLPITHRFDEMNKVDRPFNECLGHGLLGVIAANAKMYLCCQLRGVESWCIGDLNKESFAQIWNGPQRAAVAKSIDVLRCPPCRYTKYNEYLTYRKSEKLHKDFL